MKRVQFFDFLGHSRERLGGTHVYALVFEVVDHSGENAEEETEVL